MTDQDYLKSLVDSINADKKLVKDGEDKWSAECERIHEAAQEALSQQLQIATPIAPLLSGNLGALGVMVLDVVEILESAYPGAGEHFRLGMIAQFRAHAYDITMDDALDIERGLQEKIPNDLIGDTVGNA